MRSAVAYGELLQLERPIITTREAAALWRTAQGTAGRRLRTLEESGLVQRLRRGLWALALDTEAFAVAPYLTAPLPAYVSFWSAMSRHGMIEQIPGRTSVASLDRTRRIDTAVGAYAIHRVAPELFGGYHDSPAAGYLATPEKALFDTVYIRSAAGSRAFFPELILPAGFSDAEIVKWVNRIPSRRLRTIVSSETREAVRHASHE